jgi:hypothetical protein
MKFAKLRDFNGLGSQWQATQHLSARTGSQLV